MWKGQNINIGTRFWKLKIIKEIDKKWQYRMFRCECECWNIHDAKLILLTQWAIKSCWCIVKSWNHKISHWMTWTRIYRIWRNILTRCNNKNIVQYKDYWWRWIKCEWKTFQEFYDDMKEWYSDDLSIDRIDNDWNYCKENCKWSTRSEQNNNTRKNNFIPIIVYDLKWNKIWCYESIKKCSRVLWIGDSNITKVLKWDFKQCNWYIFKKI